MGKTKKEIFLESLNTEIDRKIQQIDAGKMEPVTRMKKFDYALSSVMIVASLIALVAVYVTL